MRGGKWMGWIGYRMDQIESGKVRLKYMVGLDLVSLNVIFLNVKFKLIWILL
jgi:hypothetical protein